MMKPALILAALAALTLPAVGQLAITENMSSASTNNSLGVTRGPDFWELSNFGASAIDLTGYKWNDEDGGLAAADGTPFNGTIIGPGESIVFVQDNVAPVSTPEQFRAWWGLATNVQVIFYTGNGQSSTGDRIYLWPPDAVADEDYLDLAVFGAAEGRSTFTYNPLTGAHGIFSTNGVGNAFTAALSDDVGSPGTNSGPVALAITQNPTNTTGFVGFPVSLSAAAQGLPRPHFQWLKDGTPLPGAKSPTLTITNPVPADAGNYSVVVTNGLTTLTSAVAVLTINASPTPPVFTLVPQSIEPYTNQTLTLSVAATGNPAPAFQWRKNGTNLVGETGNQLVISGLQFSDSGVYSVVASNLAGVTNVSAVVNVTTKPKLVITEILAGQAAPTTGHMDWWELTNLDDRAINLRGYRYDDSSQSFAVSHVIGQDVIIQPGESIVFIEAGPSGNIPVLKSNFLAWWGTNLPPGLQIIAWTNSGAGLAQSSDAVNFWNAAATDPSDTIASATYASAVVGTSFVYDPENPPVAGIMNKLATNGWNGAWAAVQSGDIGSPGYVVAPHRLTTTAGAGTVDISWDSTPGRAYAVDSKPSVLATNWTTVTNVTATGPATTVTLPAGDEQAVYRGRVIIPLP